MSDSRTPEDGATRADDGPERRPRYEQVFRWVKYVEANPPEVWGPQQNAVVNGQTDGARAVDLSADERRRIRAFADAELEASDDDAED